MLSLRGQVAQLLDSLPPPVVAHGTYYFSRRCCNGAALNLVLRAALYQLLCERRIPHTLHGPSHWKRIEAGSATPSQADVQAFGKAKAATAFVVAALARKYGIHFPTRVRVGHRHLAFKTDISDAVAIGIYGMTSARPAGRGQPDDGREPECSPTLARPRGGVVRRGVVDRVHLQGAVGAVLKWARWCRPWRVAAPETTSARSPQ